MTTFWQISATSSKKSNTEIWINGYIGENFFSKSTSAADFIEQISTIKTKNITVFINSRGGSLEDGIAIFNALLNHPAQITTINAATAMSAASLILQAGDSRQAFGNAITMIHDCSTSTYGDAKKHKQAAQLLEKYSTLMAVTYQSRGVKKADITGMLNGQDHYYSATEALELGLIDEITDHLKIAASADTPLLTPDHLCKHTEETMPKNTTDVESQETLSAKIKALLTSKPAAPKPEANKKETQRLDDLETAITLTAEQIAQTSKQEALTSLQESVQALATDFNALKAQINNTPNPEQPARPSATGAQTQPTHTDC